MKKILLLLHIMAFATVCSAQLTNTKWAGTMAIPEATQVYLKFTADTAQIVIADNDYVGETMLYSVKDSVITLKKVSGHSPCNSGTFTTSYSIKNNKLIIKTLSDPCDARVGMWPTTPFDKTTFK